MNAQNALILNGSAAPMAHQVCSELRRRRLSYACRMLAGRSGIYPGRFKPPIYNM